MGDNDFADGDPWGLPIEDSEEFEIEAALPEPATPPAEGGLEDDLAEEAIEPPDIAEGDTVFPIHDDVGADPGATPDAGVGVGEPDDESPGPAWWSSSEEADSSEGEADAAEESDHVPDDQSPKAEVAAEEQEEDALATTARTPLSQMIAAAQSVVSSVQGDQRDEADEEMGSKPHDSEQEITDEIALPEEPEITAAPEETEPAAVAAAQEVTEGDDDLPDEPPSWLIVKKESDQEAPEALPSDEALEPVDTFEPVDTSEEETAPSFTPADIEASIAGLATPAEVPFSEDRFDIPGEEEPATGEGFGEVDMDSSPGVYSELHHLADQDDQAEALLSEAAEAFGRSDETSIDDFAELPAAPEEIDSYAEALAAELEGDDTTKDATEDLEELPEEAPAAPEEIDSYAEALAAELEGDDTTKDVTEEETGHEDTEDLAGAFRDDVLPEARESFSEELTTELEVDDGLLESVTDDLEELSEETLPAPAGIDSYAEAFTTEVEGDDATEEVTGEETEVEVIDSYAGALTTEFEGDDIVEDLVEEGTEIEVTEEAFVDSDAEGYLSDTELGDALAGLAETSDDRFGDGAVSALEEVEEVATPDWWGEEEESDEVIISSDEAVESSIESVWPDTGELDAEEPDLLAVDQADAAGQMEPGEEAVEAGELAEAAIEGAAVIDSPVEWGTRYRDSHQGWVEDDEGHSTWRPIVTSGESVAGWEIDIYLGLVSGDVATKPDSYERIAGEVAAAREVAVRRMLDEALARGAHAVVGVTFAIQDTAGTVLVSASGVAVTLRTPA